MRIIKLSPEFIQRGFLSKNIYRYLITEGYRDFTDDMKLIFIEYCPFCGKNLSKIYKSDDYINELNHTY